MDRSYIIAMIIFLIISLCLGIPAVAWALHVLFQNARGGGRVSIYIIFLLLSDVVELFFIPFIVGSIFIGFTHGSNFMLSDFRYTSAFTGARLCGLCFHQLGALESVFSLKHPYSFSSFSSPSCSILVCLGVWICTLTILFSPSTYLFVYVRYALCALAVMTAVLTYVLTAISTRLCADPEAPKSNTRGTLHVLAVAMGTLWLLYAPFIIWFFIQFNVQRWEKPLFAATSICLMNFRVLADPLLCVLVCRETSQRVQTQEEMALNTDTELC